MTGLLRGAHVDGIDLVRPVKLDVSVVYVYMFASKRSPPTQQHRGIAVKDDGTTSGRACGRYRPG